HAALAAATAELPRHLPAHGYYEAGLPVLRAAIAERYTRRGAPTTPDQIVVTAGALHGLNLILRAFAAPGDRALVDHPTYPAALVAACDRDGGPVLSVGAMSKGFWAGLRIGWIRAAPATTARLVAARAALDLAGPVIEQLVAAQLLSRADDVLPGRREQLRAR